MKKLLFNWSPVFLYVGLIYLLSSFPLPVPEKGDKVIHFFEYALLGFLITRGVLLSANVSKFWGIFLGAFGGTLLGVLDEFHQFFVPGRQSTVGDGIADALGSVFGALLFIYVGIWLFRTHRLYKAPDNCC